MAQQVDPNFFTTPFLLTKTGHRDPYPAISPDKPENSQVGRIVIVTGGGSGIGAAAAHVWARAGASGIVLAGRRISNLEQVARELEAVNRKSQILVVQADVTVQKDVENLYAQVQRTFDRHADVLISNAGYLGDTKPIGEQDPDEWWKGMTINLKGPFLMIHHFIKAQPNPKEPVGTIVSVSAGLIGLTNPGFSSYSIAKLAAQRLGEFIDVEYPKLRMFTVMPGIVATDMVPDAFSPFAQDHADLTGMLALYLAQPRADYLKGSLLGVNWDVTEMEAHKEEIVEKKLLKISWLPVLPVCGGNGIGS